MDFDFVVTSGTIVDATGRCRFRAVLIKGQVVAREGQMVGNERCGLVSRRLQGLVRAHLS